MDPDSIVAWFQSLAERERRLVVAGAIAIGVALLVGLYSLDRGVSRAHVRLAHKQAELAWMRSVAPQLAAAAPAAAVPTSQRSLIVVIDNAAREAGLATALASSEPSGQGGLRVRLDKAPFDILVGWLARLSEQRGVHVDSATIDSAGAPGLVNAGIVFEAAH
jgi:type II secretory pathway component PulM